MSLGGRSVGTLTWPRLQGNGACRARTCFSVCLQCASVERIGDSSYIRGAMTPSCPPRTGFNSQPTRFCWAIAVPERLELSKRESLSGVVDKVLGRLPGEGKDFFLAVSLSIKLIYAFETSEETEIERDARIVHRRCGHYSFGLMASGSASMVTSTLAPSFKLTSLPDLSWSTFSTRISL